jgi:hypothetical protein
MSAQDLPAVSSRLSAGMAALCHYIAVQDNESLTEQQTNGKPFQGARGQELLTILL